MILPLQPQLPHQVVEVDRWTGATNPDIYPEGARDKKLVFCPSHSPFPFLIGEHKYLFKQSINRHPIQFFSEIIAYRLGCLIGVNVPPAFIATDESDGTKRCGALIEWFYDYPGSSPAIYLRGGDLASRVIEGFDEERGTQHDISFILTNCIALSREIDPESVTIDRHLSEHWIKIFTFDALTGNQDRHQDNWGILIEDKKNTFSPAFDNGTSLGHEIMDNKIPFFVDQRLQNYIRRGKHHLRKDQSSDEQFGHFELIQVFVNKFPHCRETVANLLNFNYDSLYNTLKTLIEFNVPVTLSAERLEFIIQLILARKTKIHETIINE